MLFLSKKAPRAKPPGDKQPPKKRQKRGPTQAIQIMRLKGFSSSKLTVVDTTRTVMEEWTAHRINRITEKLGSVKDPARAKSIRQHRNVVLAYREKLDDVLLDLQDANNTGFANTSKLKQLNTFNKQLRTEYMALQRDRDQIAIEIDDATEEYLQARKKTEDQKDLSSALYDIQAAIQNGKEKARNEGRETEGPDLPIKMLLNDVSQGIGHGAGLLTLVRSFNDVLVKTAGFLEGRT